MKRHVRGALLGMTMLGLAASVALAQPAQVLIIRTRRKACRKKRRPLSLKGQERAMAFVPFFTQTSELIFHGLPVALFATRIGPDYLSPRTLETITPLSTFLRVLIDAHYAKQDYADLESRGS